jgi:sulfite reductase beta subunit-like hemoprotein
MAEVVSYDVDLGTLEIALSERSLSSDEINKRDNTYLGGEKLRRELEDLSKPDVDKELHINMKPNGIYIQFDRSLIKEKIKDWFFMVRIPFRGGGDISPDEWIKISELAEKYSRDEDDSPSTRLTTRQAIQFHRVKKEVLLPLVRELIELGKATLNACGDNVRNTTASPVKSNIFDANSLAQRIGKYFQLPLEEHYKIFHPSFTKNEIDDNFKYDSLGLPRKLKIGIGGYYIDQETMQEVRCNAPDILTNDIAIAPIIEDNKVSGYQVYIGGSLGQKNRKVTFPSLAGALGIFYSEDDLMRGLDAIVFLQQQIGDRKNRHWSRLKNILYKKGLEISGKNIEDVLYSEYDFRLIRDLGIKWFGEEIKKLGIEFPPPVKIDLGKVDRHHGWKKQYNGKFSFGLWIENGRIKDSSNFGKLKTMIDTIVVQVKPQIRLTPFQDLLLTDIEESQKDLLDSILHSFMYGNFSSLRTNSLACVGLATCGLAVAESEKYLHPLIDELEKAGYGNLDGIHIGISGCERHCSRNPRFDISLEGKTDGEYQLKLLFGQPDKEHLASDLISSGKKYLRRIPQEQAASLVLVLVENFVRNKLPDEKYISVFHKRVGMENIIALLKENEITKPLMQNTAELFVS